MDVEPATTTTSPGEVVREFITAVGQGDFDGGFRLATDDLIFENVPQALPGRSVQGREVIRAGLWRMFGCSIRTSWDIARQVEGDGLVMHERVDSFWFPPGLFPKSNELHWPIAGVFEVTAGGLVSLWRDYYDWSPLGDQLGVDLDGFRRLRREYLEQHPA